MDAQPFSLAGQIALITGGTRGIGYGIASEMMRAGAKVIITGRSQEGVDDAVKQLGENAIGYVADVTEKSSHAPFIAKVESEVGPIDTLVNNAGRHGKMPSLEMDDEQFAAILDTNLHAIFSLTKAVLPGMMKRGSGSVINISSMSALFGLPQVAAYSASKTALLGLTRTLASEYSASGVRINAIAPGFIESKMFREIMDKDPAREQKILGRTPMNRLGHANEIGHAAVFLAADASAFISGICLPVDGGAAIGF
jgi:gluconate 5-dehydrogenase